MRKWIIDVSSWQTMVTPEQWATMVANGLSGVIMRACQSNAFVDSRLDEHLGHAKFHNLPYGLYQWVDPTRSPSAQADFFLALVDKYQPAFAAGDFEQYWSNWQDWNNKMVLHQKVELAVLPADDIFSNAQGYVNYMTTRLKVPFVGYSGAWYLNGFCPKLAGLLNNYAYWNASYVPWNQASMTYAEFDVFTANLTPGASFLPAGGTRWDIWQITSHLPLPGLPPLDIDLTRDDATFDQLFGGQGGQPYHADNSKGPVFNQYRVTATVGLRVRSTPVVASDNYLYTLKYGTIVVAYEVQNGWARVKPDRQEWCSMQWLDQIIG
jgi:GH25 family lysozyme M1 (1,4-beta-N-acetylmuramidase)